MHVETTILNKAHPDIFITIWHREELFFQLILILKFNTNLYYNILCANFFKNVLTFQIFVMIGVDSKQQKYQS